MGRILYDKFNDKALVSGLPDSRAAQEYNFAHFPSGPESGSYVISVLCLYSVFKPVSVFYFLVFLRRLFLYDYLGG